jgi:hypothetical protein
MKPVENPKGQVRLTISIAALAIGLLVGAYIWPELAWRFSAPDAKPRLVASRGDLGDDESSTIELFQKAVPSVVYITTLSR